LLKKTDHRRQVPALSQVYRWPALASVMLRWWPQRVRHRIPVPPTLSLPKQALEIWQGRPDLQAFIDITSAKGRRDLSLWLIFHGFAEMGPVTDPDGQAALLPWHDPYPGLAFATGIPISWLMFQAARREGKWKLRELRSESGQQAAIEWYFLVALDKYGWSSLLTSTQAAYLMTPDSENGGCPRIIVWLRHSHKGFQAILASPDVPALRDWLWDEGAALCPLLAHPDIGLARRRKPADDSLPFGVNLIGHARARLGIGEDVRMAAKALAAVGVPYAVFDFAAGPDVLAEDRSVDFISDDLPYAVNMFCLSGIDTARAVREIGQARLDGRHNIGFWPWELPEFPQFWHFAYDLMDEVWASSHYTYAAYSRSASVPVRHLPMAVCVDESEGLRRADFGLPDGRFLFAFAYDGLSREMRKNPQACIEAFDRAFPVGDERVGLVIKGLRAQESPFWQYLENRAGSDPRLFLEDRSLPRGQLLDLYRAVDCFVSLHRAEGFGRNIAECMLLGKPVIVTAHSGNMDFTHADTAALVRVTLRPVGQGEYPFSAGQMWAEPDVKDAALMMQRMVEDATWRETLAAQGTAAIRSRYGPDCVGRIWLGELQKLVGMKPRAGKT
jgi:glycosyltransferase involved in cell wall biosynthesis